MKKGLLINLCILFFALYGRSQSATVVGKVTDERGIPLPFVVVYELQTPQQAVQTDFDGNYKLQVTTEKSCTIVFTITGYKKITKNIELSQNDIKSLDIKLETETREVPAAIVVSKRENDASLVKINPKYINNIPSVGMSSVETGIKTQPGVTSRNEFSSQYNVRGGNFDENLTYVNDIMIYRPLLIRSGQQEGLSFINPDMVANIQFSSGGFNAEYGDRMSSVLDISYRKPTAFAATASVALIGATGCVEDVSKNGKFSIITGVRYKNNRMILRKMDEKGEYKPSFADAQTQILYQISKRSQMGFLGYFAYNNYLFIPKTKQTVFGNTTNQYQMSVAFDGSEQNRTSSIAASLWNTWSFKENSNLKLSTSIFESHENESYDISTFYWLNQMQTSVDQNSLDSVQNLAVGSYFKHARNELLATISTTSLLYTNEIGISTFSSGIEFQHHEIDENLNMWTYVDSAEYNMPYSDSVIKLKGTVFNKIDYRSEEGNAFIQNTWKLQLEEHLMSITAGLRSNYKTSNEQLTLSPRIRLSIKPAWQRNVLFRLAFGYYFQSPLFKEMVGIDGTFFSKSKAQEAIHYVAAMDNYIKLWGRPFKLTSEAYYKDLKKITPYTVDNVSIQYFPDKTAKGYATGLDLKLNGEFIIGTESWVSLSVMQTKEKINGIDNSWQRRPTDQLINFGMFVQDYLPGNKTYKMNLTMFMGTNVPSNPPVLTELSRTKETLKAYRRVDVGFSKQIIEEQEDNESKNKLLKSLWAGIDILNIFDFGNTASYFWIQDVKGKYYPTPNYLTSRMLSVKITAKI